MSTPTQSPPIATAAPSTSKSAGLGGGAIAGIATATLLVVLLCLVSTIVCLVLLFAKKSKKKTRQKTFGKARFIRSVYYLPTLYKVAKTDTAKKGSTEQRLASTKEEEEREEEVEQQQQGVEQQQAEQQGAEIELSDTYYVNQQEFTQSTDPLTPAEEEVVEDENFYENNPLARKFYRGKKEKEKEKENGKDRERKEGNQESTRDYVNKEMFIQPSPPLGTELASNGVDTNNDDQLYVNNLLARKLYENERPDISTTPNKAYGVTERSDNLSDLMQPNQQQSETNGEDEYVYVDIDKDTPEEEYEDMANFQKTNFTNKQRH